MKASDIKDLEKKYMNKIYSIINSKSFKDDIKEIEKYTIDNYTYLDENWDEKNKIKVGVERVIRYYFYRQLDVVNIYPSPLSSDMAIELEDVILNIDAKTIDMIGNPGDDTAIHFQKNQITFENKPFYAQVVNGYTFKGIPFPPNLEAFHKGKPCLTFFITVNYEDDAIRKTFKLSHMSVCCVPHKLIVESDYDNDILSNYKTYEYVGKVKSDEIGTQYAPKTTIDPSWIGFPMKGNGANDSYLDPNQDNPYIFGSKSVRKKIGGKWSISKSGGSARIDKTKLTDRVDANGKKWLGYRKIVFNYI